ncbi:MAG: acyltransferase family protein [Actinomycetota bacterium]
MQAAAIVDIAAAPDVAPPARASAHVERLQTLDVLRGVALLLVMGRHMYVTAAWHRLGWLGVHLFFVLSGFLVAGLLFREHQRTGRLDIRRFLIRRAFKIYPSFWLLLAVTLPLAYLSPVRPTPTQLASELLFLQSYVPGYWMHTWSLAVEEHFYLLLAGSLMLLLRLRRTADPFALIPCVTLAIGIACLAARVATTASAPFQHYTHVFPTHLRLDALSFGVCLSYWFHLHRDAWALFMKRHVTRLWLLSLVCLAPLTAFEITTGWFVITVGMTVGYVGIGALLMAAVYSESLAAPPGRGVGHVVGRVLAWLGRNSYGIYLWHLAVAVWAVGKLKVLVDPDMPYSVELAIYFLGSIALGAVATRLVERPLLELRDRWRPSRNAA